MNATQDSKMSNKYISVTANIINSFSPFSTAETFVVVVDVLLHFGMNSVGKERKQAFTFFKTMVFYLANWS